MNEKEPERLAVKCCYGHLGGMLGDRLFDRMLELGWFCQEDGTKSFSLTELGTEEFKKLGVDLYKRRK
jgi:hypothetical protein